MRKASGSSAAGPLARSTELTVEHLSSETIIYDHQRHRVHCLNNALTFVFGQCDGRSSVQEIAERLPHALNLPPDPDIVLLALRQLKKIHLLTDESTDFTFDELPSRRELAGKLAALGVTATTLLPAVMSVVAPTPAMAQSGDSYAGPGNGNGNGKGNGLGEQNSNGHGHPHS